MPTYTIVANDTDPLGPNEIAAGDTIFVSDGDIYIIDPSADSNITFEASGGGPAEFDIQISSTPNDGFNIQVKEDLTPNITIGNRVDLSETDLDVKATDAATLTAGNDVSLGKYDGSESGPNTVVVGNRFTTDSDWKFGDAADSLTVGNDGTFKNLDAGDGDDTISFGFRATIHDFKTGSGNDSVTFGDDLDAHNIKTEDGNDVIRIGKDAQVDKIDGGNNSDVLYTETEGLQSKDIENTQVVCFASGMLIETPDGSRALETLQSGDLVVTFDHGPQPIRWVRSSDHPLEEVIEDAKPVLIAAGALGKGLPTQNLIVSPQHRILVGGGGQLMEFFEAEAFAPAKALTGLPGVRHMKGKSKITWNHFACDRHEVVTANGCLSESLLLGPVVVDGLTIVERHDLNAIFDTAISKDAALNGPPARVCLTVSEVRRLLAEYVKEKGQRTEREIRKWDCDLAMERYEAERLGLASTRCADHTHQVAV